MKLREALADALVAEDVQLLFALMGDANLELICDVAERCGVPVVFGRHEQGWSAWRMVMPASPVNLGWLLSHRGRD